MFSRPYAGFFEIKSFNDFLTEDYMARTIRAGFHFDEAFVSGVNGELRIGTAHDLCSLPVLFERRGSTKATYSFNKYYSKLKPASLEYVKHADRVSLSVLGEEVNKLRQEVLRGESDKLLNDLEGHLVRHGRKKEKVRKSGGRVRSEALYHLEKAGLDIFMKYFSTELSGERNGYTLKSKDRTDTLSIKYEDLVVKLSREMSSFSTVGRGESVSGGCFWRPWQCDAPLPDPIVGKLYDLLY